MFWGCFRDKTLSLEKYLVQVLQDHQIELEDKDLYNVIYHICKNEFLLEYKRLFRNSENPKVDTEPLPHQASYEAWCLVGKSSWY